ncbi:hypothetical protein E4U13_005771 [Claviceps humidiphila]|uniref:DUF159 domain protein n=1 Tax=Claviceps humidiphila TaxID=1294629 RepID=A0A9P7Q711_9HYPO|nr:hypothetical protein E4U13_005771 [Claviceps humidiphila]
MLQEDNVVVDETVQDDGPDAPRQSYNFAPGYHGVVYRADTPDWGAGPRSDAHRVHYDEDGGNDADDACDAGAADNADDTHAVADASHVKYKLQAMKWGLVPFWTKRNPDYQTLMKTINCRDDSLSSPGGMWASMKSKKRCIVIAQGFFEWLKTGPKDKLPHYVKRKDGRLMCFAGLWDCVQYPGSEEKLYTYTIITTDSNKQLRFLHDRMPVVLDPGSDEMRRWVDPGSHEWSSELQALLRPFDGELEVYPVSKDVGKVGNNSPSFLIPLNSKENKNNIANFFQVKAEGKQSVQQGQFIAETKSKKGAEKGAEEDSQPKAVEDGEPQSTKKEDEEHADAAEVSKSDTKRKLPLETGGSPSKKVASERAKISATKNEPRQVRKSARPPGSQKITRFFGNSA